MREKAMTIKIKLLRTLTVTLAVTGFALVCGHFQTAEAQTRDPFAKPAWARTRETRSGTVTIGPGSTGPKDTSGAPPIDQRIAYYMQLRESAAASGRPLPKVTSVLTLSEMSVTGIFRTPRGYAAMVEALPIKLSYTIYPGERFFDGQLVAVDENRLVFKKVTKVGKGKFVSSVENKPLRQYTDREVLQGTAPSQADTASSTQPVGTPIDSRASVGPIVSPLDEMNREEPEEAKTKPAQATKRPVRSAKNNK